jgi:hypothetical protein
MPERAIVFGDPLALLATVTLPVTLPAEMGLNNTPNVKACVDDNVTGVPAPLSAKPVPLLEICEMVTFELPTLVTVTLCEAELPSFTLPKLTLLVLNERVCDAAVPVPVSEITAGEPGALLTKEALPLAAPADDGANCRLKLLDCPAFREMGRVAPLLLKPLPATLICEMVSTPVPELVTFMVCVFEEPTEMLPKLTDEGVTLMAG